MTAIEAVVAFAGWTLALVFIVFAYRGVRVLQGVAINSWGRGARTTSDAAFVKRAEDAHANAVENLVAFAAIVMGGHALGRIEALTPFAAWVFYARIGQSVVHLIGTSVPLVMVRATFWGIQLALMLYMVWRLLA